MSRRPRPTDVTLAGLHPSPPAIQGLSIRPPPPTSVSGLAELNEPYALARLQRAFVDDDPKHDAPAAAAKTEAMMENPHPRQRSRRRAAAACLALCLIALGGAAARAQSVAFINPGKSDEIYWMTATQGMQAVARASA